MTSNPQEPYDMNTLATRLLSLRRNGTHAPTASFALPADWVAAEAVQALLSAHEQVGGMAFKVAATPDGTPLVAPLYPYVEMLEGAVLPFVQGMKFEVEIALRLGGDLPVRAGGYSRDAVKAAVGDVRLGIELLGGAITEGASLSFPLFVADRLGNRGYVLGPRLPAEMIEEGQGQPLVVTRDGQTLFDGPARHPAGDVLDWLVRYANRADRPAASLAAGMMITTGALCGALALPGPGRMDVAFAGHSLGVTLV